MPLPLSPPLLSPLLPLFSSRHLHIYASHHLPPALPPQHVFLSAHDQRWLAQCSHPSRKISFLKGRWLAYQLTTQPVHPMGNRRIRSPHAVLSITHKDDITLVAITQKTTISHPPRPHLPPHLPPFFLGIDLEKRILPQKLSSWLVRKLSAIIGHPPPTELPPQQWAAMLFSTREALIKALSLVQCEHLASHYTFDRLHALSPTHYHYHMSLPPQYHSSLLPPHLSGPLPKTLCCQLLSTHQRKKNYVLSLIAEPQYPLVPQ